MDIENLKGLTEREVVWRLLFGEVSEDELIANRGTNIRTESILSEYRSKKAELQDPSTYWDEVIKNATDRLEEARASKIANELPLWWLRGQSGHAIPK